MSEQPRTQTKRQEADPAPWKPAPYEIAHAAAIQALIRGDATPDQQRLAIVYVVEQLCGTYELSFRPGPSPRDTDFAEGRRFVGLQIVKLSKLALSKLREGPSEQP